MIRYIQYRKNYAVCEVLKEYEVSETLINVKENRDDNNKIKIKIENNNNVIQK